MTKSNRHPKKQIAQAMALRKRKLRVSLLNQVNIAEQNKKNNSIMYNINNNNIINKNYNNINNNKNIK